MRAVKLVADGALGSRGAALIEDYADEPGNRGLLVTAPDRLYAVTRAASEARFQTAIHAIGDRANHEVLGIFERVAREVPGARDLRLRDEHAQIVDATDIPSFARLGRHRLDPADALHLGHAVGATTPWRQPGLPKGRTRGGRWSQRAPGWPTAQTSRSSVRIPLLGFYAAITRQDATGSRPAGGRPTSGSRALRRCTA